MKKEAHNNLYAISIDSSSSACKTSIIGIDGKVLKSFSVPLQNFQKDGGIFEHDPIEIWEKQFSCMELALQEIDLDCIVGIGITNQRETIVAWDSKTTLPVYRAISWQDSRNDEFLKKYKNYEELLKEKTGLCLNLYFSAPKIQWILENVNCSLDSLRIGTIDSWIIANLTNHEVFATDITNASRTLLMNLETEDWDEELLDLFSIPRHILPSIFPSGHLYGYWNYKGKNIPIYGVIGDQQASLLCGCFNKGEVKCTYGTGLFMMMNIGMKKEYLDNTITTVAWKIGSKSTCYALECGSFFCGNYIQDLFEKKYFSSYEIKNLELENSVYFRLGGKKIFMFDDVGYSDVIIGIPKNAKGEIVLKGAIHFLALLANEMISIFRKKFSIDEIMVGGSLTNIDYLNNFQSSLSKVKIIKSNYVNNSALGAAYLVFLSKGILKQKNFGEFNGESCVDFRFNHSKFEMHKLIDLWKSLKTVL